MMGRRTMLSGAIAAGLAGSGLAAGAGNAAAALRPDEAGQASRDDRDTAEAIRQVLAELRDQRASCDAFSCPWVEKLRQTQKQFFKTNGKFPDFIDIGIDTWERVYDWHVRAGQPLTISRLADGRYAIAFMLTTLVLRADVNNDFVSLGYDAK